MAVVRRSASYGHCPTRCSCFCVMSVGIAVRAPAGVNGAYVQIWASSLAAAKDNQNRLLFATAGAVSLPNSGLLQAFPISFTAKLGINRCQFGLFSLMNPVIVAEPKPLRSLRLIHPSLSLSLVTPTLKDKSTPARFYLHVTSPSS